MLPAAPALPPPPNEQEGKCQLGFVLCSSGCRSSHLLKPTQLLIGRLAGLGGGGLGTALVAAGCQRWTGWRLLEDPRRQEGTGESSQVRTTGVVFASFFTIIKGTRSKDLGVFTYPESMPLASTSLWTVFPFRGKARNLLSVAAGLLEQSSKRAGRSRAMCRTGRLPGQWVFSLPCGSLTHFPRPGREEVEERSTDRGLCLSGLLPSLHCLRCCLLPG